MRFPRGRGVKGMLTFGLLRQLPCPEPVTVSSASSSLFAQKEPLLSQSPGFSGCPTPSILQPCLLSAVLS